MIKTTKEFSTYFRNHDDRFSELKTRSKLVTQKKKSISVKKRKNQNEIL